MTDCRVVVGVTTYRRPEPLRAMLSSLLQQKAAPPFTVIVVDNDPAESARPVLEDFPSEWQYLVEATPGIAAGRNKVLDALPDDADVLVFIDDDELAPPPWLAALLAGFARWEVDIVGGPVRTLLPETSPAWARSGVLQRPVQRAGSADGLPATNNVAIDLRAWRGAGQPHFSEEFSLTGGSDSEFFRRVTRDLGMTFAWEPAAWVDEPWPQDRLSRRWLWRRSQRGGNVLGRLDRRDRPGIAIVAGGVLRSIKAIPVAVSELLAGRLPWKAMLVTLPRGLGYAGAGWGREVIEYARASADNSVPGAGGTLNKVAWNGMSFRQGTVPRAIAALKAAVRGEHEPTHVHLCNSWTIALAEQDARLAGALRTAAATNLVDGVPLSIALSRRPGGSRDTTRGPTLFREGVVALASSGYRQLLFGGTEDSLNRIMATFAEDGVDITTIDGYSPPMRSLDDEAIEEYLDLIATSKADVIWIGLGTPKQDILAAAVTSRLGITAVCVGAAFDFVAGTVRPAPSWLQGSGFEWLYRFAKEPRRLWRRYTLGNLQFLWVLAREELRGARP
ncbi:WecB/TagA/CpsF family glycosyltransferase [Microbacterium album]|uniref:Glycosyltransferase 2-like domain-containing protein n=1 Tax=Microbacterium album TaxID=2053191 RepID=A0A917IGD2_9MICO|nr:WecB/TagA/CpsF family glycosyltransferase [Microbacterium album]GGH41165.1 hypothetical protein GCM10010921_13550 [Microbacterium album]